MDKENNELSLEDLGMEESRYKTINWKVLDYYRSGLNPVENTDQVEYVDRDELAVKIKKTRR